MMRVLIAVTVGTIPIGAVFGQTRSPSPQPVTKPAHVRPESRLIEHRPDIIASNLWNDVRSYGTESNISAFSAGMTACNVGNWPVMYDAYTNLHPVITQNAYRLHHGRFEQLGMSWVYHTFFAIASTACGQCVFPKGFQSGRYLGILCANPESAIIMGSQSSLSPRGGIDAHTAHFDYPGDHPPPTRLLGRRLQIHNADLDPATNPDALYFLEIHVLAPDDAAAGNGDNNASHREATVLQHSEDDCRLPDDTGFCLETVWPTYAEEPAIRAWKRLQPTVMETELRVPGEGLFILAADAWQLPNGFWRYEYALYNMNSDRAGRSFTVPVPADAAVENIGFHDVDYHSGEPFDPTDWSVELSAEAVSWSTDSFDTNPKANALRWGTLYNFRFDADVPPASGQAEVALFKPGNPQSIKPATVVPSSPH